MSLCHLTGPAAPVVYAVTGVLAWSHGEGTLARLCANACLRHQPDHSLALLLARLLDVGAAPGPFLAKVAA